MKSCKVGVIGTGALGRHHTRLYGECEQAQLMGIFDVDQEAAERVAAEFGTKAFKSMEDMLNSVDGVSVAVPTHLHHKVVMEILHANKHVLVEKPITQNVEEAEELVALAEQKKLILSVGHVERFNPVLSSIHEVPGATRFIESHRLAAYPPPRPGLHPRGTEVSVVLDLMIHDIDVVLSLVDSEISHVDAVGVSVLSPTEDIANARLVFKNGAVANLTASRISQEQMRKIRLFKSNAYMSLDYQDHEGEIATLSKNGVDRQDIPVKTGNALKSELLDFVNCIIGYGEQGATIQPKVSGLQGMKALKVADMILASIAEKDQMIKNSSNEG